MKSLRDALSKSGFKESKESLKKDQECTSDPKISSGTPNVKQSSPYPSEIADIPLAKEAWDRLENLWSDQSKRNFIFHLIQAFVDQNQIEHSFGGLSNRQCTLTKAKLLSVDEGGKEILERIKSDITGEKRQGKILGFNSSSSNLSLCQPALVALRLWFLDKLLTDSGMWRMGRKMANKFLGIPRI